MRAFGGPFFDAEDLAQEVFVVVRRKLPGFQGDDPAAWLWSITRNVTRAARRRAWLRSLLFDPDPETLASLPDGGARPDEVAERRRRERDADRLQSRRSDKRRTVLVLYEVVGHTTEENARLLDVPHATVRTRLHHARKEFVTLAAAHRLDEDQEDES